MRVNSQYGIHCTLLHFFLRTILWHKLTFQQKKNRLAAISYVSRLIRYQFKVVLILYSVFCKSKFSLKWDEFYAILEVKETSILKSVKNGFIWSWQPPLWDPFEKLISFLDQQFPDNLPLDYKYTLTNEINLRYKSHDLYSKIQFWCFATLGI